jgi:hypothetical protein
MLNYRVFSSGVDASGPLDASASDETAFGSSEPAVAAACPLSLQSCSAWLGDDGLPSR